MRFRHYYDDCITSIVVLKAERGRTNGHMIPEPYPLLRFAKFQNRPILLTCSLICMRLTIDL